LIEENPTATPEAKDTPPAETKPGNEDEEEYKHYENEKEMDVH